MSTYYSLQKNSKEHANMHFPTQIEIHFYLKILFELLMELSQIIINGKYLIPDF